ncbi:hypothetical protein [Chryseobacterium defluvii]|uniref:Uncharacterized protein n=1 Tax=Chryseobacterium defluvii TaxID=160396 RepID=A0A495SLR8_9FLAO|nr:hypothetical protein [Chryseobacterium defluvii]RKT01123.1 hypothetical protein BCF58_0338 [Chryseobacterium defluvii]
MRKKLFVAGACMLLAFQSCNNNDELSGQDHSTITKTETTNQSSVSRVTSDSQSLSGYVSNQIATQTEIKNLLDNETNVDYSAIQAGLQNIQTIEELELLYKNANVVRAEELVSLYEELNSNTEIFINSNRDFYANYSEEDRLRLLSAEIDSQLSYNDSETFARTNCHANFVKASKRCMKKFAMEVGLAAIGGIFTGGTTAVIGSGIATVNMIMCNADADEDYHDCVHEGGQP